MTATVSGYLIIISTDLYAFISLFFSLVLVSIEKKYQPLKTMLDHTTKHFKVLQKYSAVRRIFNSLLGVLIRSQTRSFVFDISLKIHSPFCLEDLDGQATLVFHVDPGE